MKILWLAVEIPYPPSSGGRLHTYSLLRRIASRHEVWFAGLDAGGSHADLEVIAELCVEVASAPRRDGGALAYPGALFGRLARGVPPDLRYTDAQGLRVMLRGWLQAVPFDVVHIENTEMAQYLDLLPPRLRRVSVWHLQDLDWQKYARMAAVEPRRARRWRNRLNSWLLRSWTPRQARRFSCCTVVSEDERALLSGAAPGVRIEVIPTGVELADNPYQGPLPDEPVLLFVGNMGYRPNSDAVTYFHGQVLPRIRARVPGVRLVVVGGGVTPEVRALAGGGVEITGRVDDVRPYYARARALVLPLRAGSGTRLKVPEAMALGRPVVSTTLGCEGRGVRQGEGVLLADNAQDFADACVRVLTDDDLARRLALSGRCAVEARYGYEGIANRLESLLERVSRGAWQ